MTEYLQVSDALLMLTKFNEVFLASVLQIPQMKFPNKIPLTEGLTSLLCWTLLSSNRSAHGIEEIIYSYLFVAAQRIFPRCSNPFWC